MLSLLASVMQMRSQSLLNLVERFDLAEEEKKTCMDVVDLCRQQYGRRARPRWESASSGREKQGYTAGSSGGGLSTNSQTFLLCESIYKQSELHDSLFHLSNAERHSKISGCAKQSVAYTDCWQKGEADFDLINKERGREMEFLVNVHSNGG